MPEAFLALTSHAFACCVAHLILLAVWKLCGLRSFFSKRSLEAFGILWFHRSTRLRSPLSELPLAVCRALSGN